MNQGYHVQITARSESDLSPESIIQKVADASGAKYSVATSIAPTPSTRPPPPTAAKPAYKPSTTTGTSRAAAYGYKPGKVDSDGWGEDAPQVSRSKLENTKSAYQPTKVDINTLKAMPSSTTEGLRRPGDERPGIIGGAYVPVGKVDIAAIKAASKMREDRPEPVKGVHQPVGKVDIAAIRAQAKPKSEPPASVEPPKSLGERSATFTPPPHAERLTSLPKPKPAKKFGSGAPTFTKPPTPGGLGPIPISAPVGAANKDFASQGGKTPAQLWAEKKARERGEPLPLAVSPASTGSQSKTAGVEEPTFSGVSAMKSKFGTAPPMGAQYSGRSASPPPQPEQPQPPQSQPQVGRSSLIGPGALIMPGFPSHVQAAHEETPIPPPPPPQPPRSPTPPTPPTPPRASSPVRIAMPVGRGHDEPVQSVEPQPSIPVESLSRIVPHEEDLSEEEPARERSQVAAEVYGNRGQKLLELNMIFEKAYTNEIDLAEKASILLILI